MKMRSRSRSRRILQAGAIAFATLLLAGCNAIPSSGPVELGLTDLKQVEQLVQFNPSGPLQGSSQEGIVRGFLQAATSSIDDYSVAREFLSVGYANQWDPYYGVLIDDGSRSYREEGKTAGVLSLAAEANVDGQGILLPAEPGPATDMRFEFEREGDEWRISSAPSGIILDRSDFLAIWSSHELNFIGPGGLLVPENRWYLSRTALATEIVGGLLEGPGQGLQESVRTGFPAGSSLVGGTVPVVDGRAKIDLSGEVLEAGPEALEEVVQQLRASLNSVQGVKRFELLVNGASIKESSTSSPGELRPPVDTATPAAVVGKSLGVVVGGEFRELEGLSAQVLALDPDAVILSPDSSAAAVRNSAGVSRVSSDESVLVDGRAGLLEPSFDYFGNIWSAEAGAADQIHVSTPDGGELTVAAQWLKGRSPVALRLSPDGTQIAALVPSGEGSAVLVAGVIRDESGLPLRTSDEATPQLWTTGAPVDLDWVDQSRFVALTKLGAASKVTIGAPGVFAADQGTVPGGVKVSGGGSRSLLRVLGDGDDIFAAQGSGWQRTDTEVALLTKRG